MDGVVALGLAKADAARRYKRVPTLAHAATLYVTPDGNDARDGLTWETAKATVQAAVNALAVNGGRVLLGYGTHAVSSTGRFDSVTFTSGSATATDASITNADLGSWVISPYLPDLAQITAVTPGVSFTTSVPARTSGAVQTIITKPAIVLPAGVELVGCGSSWQDAAEVHYAPQASTTEILDSGTGVTIISKKIYLATNQSQDYMRCGLTDLTVRGTSANMFGFFGENIWYGVATNVTFMSHGLAGAVLAYNMNSTAFRDCRFLGNGTPTATMVTGGALLSTPSESASSSVQFDNCFFSNNYGFGVAGTNSDHARTAWTTVAPVNAATLLNCQFNHIEVTTLTDSGTGAYIGADGGQGLLLGCWFETCATRGLMIAANPGAVTAIACHFNGQNGHGGNNAVCVLVNNGYGSPRPSSFNAIGCFFRNATTVYVQLGSATSMSWMGCQVDQSNTTTPFVNVNSVNTPSTLAPGIGQVGRFSSKPYQTLATAAAQAKVTLVAGTVTVADTAITANSIVRLSRQTAGGTLGQLSVVLTAGTGFTINSSSGTDTSSVFYEVVSY